MYEKKVVRFYVCTLVRMVQTFLNERNEPNIKLLKAILFLNSDWLTFQFINNIVSCQKHQLDLIFRINWWIYTEVANKIRFTYVNKTLLTTTQRICIYILYMRHFHHIHIHYTLIKFSLRFYDAKCALEDGSWNTAVVEILSLFRNHCGD